MPLVSALGRQRQVDLCEFKASLVYRLSSRTTRVTQKNPVLKNKNPNKQTNKQKTNKNQNKNPQSTLGQ